MWSAAHPDAFASATLVNTGVLLDYRWHHYAKVWRTPGLGELFQATTTRPAFRMLIGRENPRLSRRARTASPWQQAERQRESFPSARIELLEGLGHWPFLEDPGRVNEQVIPFLREVTAAST
jgi:hypothetical protein